MGVTVLVFTVENVHPCISSDVWERTGASYKMACVWKGEESIKKQPFLRNLHRDITVRTQDGAEKKLKWVSTSLTCTIEVLHEEVEVSNTRIAYNAHSQHIESHLGKKQSQEKIPIAFLFSQLHFNNVTSDSLFMAAILLGAVSDAQCKTSESP